MKILVIDDNPINIASALQTLKGHEVTTCSASEDADVDGSRRLLYKQEVPVKDGKRWFQRTHELTMTFLKEQGVCCEKPWINAEEEYTKAYKRADAETSWYWDVVLLDFLMPFEGVEEPVGMKFALQAVEGGAKYVLVSSNSNTHDNPDDPEAYRSQLLHDTCRCIKMNESFFFSTRLPPMVKIEGTDQEGKDWGRMLAELMIASTQLSQD